MTEVQNCLSWGYNSALKQFHNEDSTFSLCDVGYKIIDAYIDIHVGCAYAHV